MIFTLGEWCISVDTERTKAYSDKKMQDRCQCGYCRNFCEAIDGTYPELRPFLEAFGVHIEAPNELMPFEPTLMLACYRVDGQILQWGKSRLSVKGVDILPESGDEETFLLWVGEMQLPWLQSEPVEDVVSPANLPEFMERMQEVWLLRHGKEFVFS